jgi:periplasmic protein TonB
MRKVYHNEKSAAGLAIAVIASVGLTAVLFGFLPFAHQVAKPKATLEILKVGAVDLPPPVEEAPPPPPPAQEEEKPPEKPPEPQLTEAPVQIAFNVSLDVAVGTGGGSLGPSGFGFSARDAAKEATDQPTVFDMADLDKQPELVGFIRPAYPNDMRKAKVEGKVTILFVLTEDGRVEDPRIEGSTRPEFEKPALDAVRKWKFRPGTRGGEAVRTYMKLPIAFRLSS